MIDLPIGLTGRNIALRVNEGSVGEFMPRLKFQARNFPRIDLTTTSSPQRKQGKERARTVKALTATRAATNHYYWRILFGAARLQECAGRETS